MVFSSAFHAYFNLPLKPSGLVQALAMPLDRWWAPVFTELWRTAQRPHSHLLVEIAFEKGSHRDNCSYRVIQYLMLTCELL